MVMQLNARISPNRPLPSVRRSEDSFQSSGKRITVERFDPATPGSFPAVLVLHGSGGPQAGADAIEYSSNFLASHGYAVILVHYFDRTGTAYSDAQSSQQNFLPWLQTIKDAVTYAGQQPSVDPNRIGLIGFSLGAYLSLAYAMQDPRVKAVGEFFGGLPDFFTRSLKQMPPTLILHGDSDKTVSVQEAYKLQRLFKENHVPFEIKIYHGQGHGFGGAAGADALQRTLTFFDKNLKDAPAVK